MRISALIITSCKGLGTDEKHTVGDGFPVPRWVSRPKMGFPSQDGFPVPRQEIRPLHWRYLVQYRQNYNASEYFCKAGGLFFKNRLLFSAICVII